MPVNDPFGTGASGSVTPGASSNSGAIGGDYNVPGGGGVAGGYDTRQGTNPLNGFSSRYTPALLNNIIWDSPWAVLPDTFSGINMAGPGYQALRDFGADPLTLYNIMNGAGGNDLTSAGVGGFANFMNALYTSMGTQGGRAFSTRELLNNISGADPNSALGKIMLSGDAGTQVRTLFNLIRESTNAGMNPLAARGYQAAAARQGDQYLNQVINAPDAASGAANQPFYQWMRQNGYL